MVLRYGRQPRVAASVHTAIAGNSVRLGRRGCNGYANIVWSHNAPAAACRALQVVPRGGNSQTAFCRTTGSGFAEPQTARQPLRWCMVKV